MRFSQLFGKPTKSVPADATAASHKLLHQGGFIRQIASGRYAYLPLGYRVWEKVMHVVDTEMARIGSQRINTPTLHPIEIWKKTNRDAAFGGLMLTVEDHHGATFALGATAEGLMTDLAGDMQPSYKDLPFVYHQFSQKFRDEKRPRGGLLRAREFMMKDAYSFHSSEEDLLVWYDRFFNAYLTIAKNLDLDVLPVAADSGAIGGDYNHEFMVVSEMGEDTIVVCEEIGYAANLERAESEFTPVENDTEMKEVEEFHHDTATTCEDLAQAMGIPVEATMKTLLFKADDQFVAAMIRGDYEVNETKVRVLMGADDLRLCTEEEVKELTGAEIGFAGPIGLPESVTLIADLTCEGRTNFEAGANKTGVHLNNLNYERDLPTPRFADIRTVKEGDTAVGGKGTLSFKRAIEWGHTFHQAQFYSTPHEATFTAEDGSKQILWQGAYGIGIGRSIATIVETHHDEKGIMWPTSITPYHVHLVVIDSKEEGPAKRKEQDEILRQAQNDKNSRDKSSEIRLEDYEGKPRALAEALYAQLVSENVDVLYDDRETSAGIKFNDMDLIGIPLRIVISSRSLANGGVEVSRRQGDESDVVTPGEVADLVRAVYT